MRCTASLLQTGRAVVLEHLPACPQLLTTYPPVALCGLGFLAQTLRPTPRRKGVDAVALAFGAG